MVSEISEGFTDRSESYLLAVVRVYLCVIYHYGINLCFSELVFVAARKGILYARRNRNHRK